MDDTNYYENMITELRAERDALRQQQADDAETITAAANTIRELRAERNNWHVAADIELAKAITAEAELRSRTENLDDSCATLAKVEAERDALRALLNEAQGFIPTDTGWDYTTDAGGYLYDRIDAALAKEK